MFSPALNVSVSSKGFCIFSYNIQHHKLSDNIKKARNLRENVFRKPCENLKKVYKKSWKIDIEETAVMI